MSLFDASVSRRLGPSITLKRVTIVVASVMSLTDSAKSNPSFSPSKIPAYWELRSCTYLGCSSCQINECLGRMSRNCRSGPSDLARTSRDGVLAAGLTNVRAPTRAQPVLAVFRTQEISLRRL